MSAGWTLARGRELAWQPRRNGLLHGPGRVASNAAARWIGARCIAGLRGGRCRFRVTRCPRHPNFAILNLGLQYPDWLAKNSGRDEAVIVRCRIGGDCSFLLSPYCVNVELLSQLTPA
jgi:hypothetical protein